ncbi:SID1 transmembrane family member 2 isoform X5 [Crotalus tigris]|uniref:SID1 transmembrane family member 2 isoform X5 n=1 Tax=Crotalus tigris TaxID=88082 RepID=UPI00192F6689|nr:SID1 transmembrane family member 2 isoform X5 [Crotalus tigris]
MAGRAHWFSACFHIKICVPPNRLVSFSLVGAVAGVFTPRELRSRARPPPSEPGRPLDRGAPYCSGRLAASSPRPALAASPLKDVASAVPPRRAERPSSRPTAPAARPLAMLRAPLPLLLLLPLLPLSGAAAWPAEKRVVQKEAAFERLYGDAVNEKLLNIYAFNHTVSRNRTEGVRVSVNVLSEQKERPVLFVVRQKEAVVSFQVPLILRGLFQRKYLYQDVSRTLCQPPTKSEVEMQFFFVDVSTLSASNASYQLRVSRVENFVLRTGERFTFNATAAQPQYFKYEFPEGVDSAIIKVTSSTAFPCSVISVQDILCPVYDLDNNVAFIGTYQTMTKKAAITVQKKDFPSQSFYVVVVVKTEDEACGGPLHYYPFSKDEPVDQGNRQKTLDVVVTPAVSSEAYVNGILFCLGVFLSFYILAVLIVCWENWRQQKRRQQQLRLLSAVDTPCSDGSVRASLLGNPQDLPDSFHGHPPLGSQSYGSFADTGSAASSENVTDSLLSTETSSNYADRSLENLVGRPRLDSLSSVEEDDYDTLADIESDKNVIRTKKFLCVADLARKDKRVLRKKYQIYFWNIATIAVFYALPVIQLVITYQTVVNVTGNQDICYYNFLCAHPLSNLSAFNNILSNLGYVLLGLLFLLIILQREIHYNRALVRNDFQAVECGIPKHFGLFYAMGTALMMEGLLSACYHVCPNYTNFQFDTSFMYMIAGLCMLKLYQKRHPDINASAYSAYACLAVIIFFSVVGVVFGKGNTAFWIIFSVIHILSTLLLSTQLYYMGRWKLDSGTWRRIFHVLYTDCIRQCSRPMYMDRMVLLVMGNFINWSLAAYGLIMRPNDFASYLLAIGICNLLLYFAFYIIMKLRSGERLLLVSLLCIVCTSVVWGFALFFFFQGLSTWQKTPAESREHNRECLLLGFFDDHDVWHFLSSIAMFGSFLVLLTMDDDLDCVQRDKIYVF